jgi:uncharacterized protein (DUF342 family)
MEGNKTIAKYIGMVTELEELNTTISSISSQLIIVNEEIAVIDDQIDKMQKQEMFVIARKMDDKGKFLFSNAELRQTELNTQLIQNPEYGNLLNQKREKNKKKLELQIQEGEFIRRWDMMMRLIK